MNVVQDAIEASGATVVPVGVGQSARLLELIPRLGITAIFGTLSFPAHLAGRAREAGVEAPDREGLRPALELAIRYAHEQGLLPRPLSLDEAWEGSPPGLA